VGEHHSVKQTVATTQAPVEWSELLARVSRGETRVLVEQGGTALAALVSPVDLERLTRLDAERDARFAAIEAIWARNVDRDPEETERDVAEAIAELRAASRASSAHHGPS
jgi:antitoxin (DNA-binding transcriptional repressor) of toxin-antitoxin stability system